MKPVWLFEETQYDDNYKRFLDEAKRQGFETATAKYAPFHPSEFEGFAPNPGCVIFYGSLNFAKRIQISPVEWTPGTFCNLPNFKCSTYYPYYHYYLLNKDWRFVPLQDFIKRQTEYLAAGPLFVRPDAGDKLFTGGIVDCTPSNETCLPRDLVYGKKPDFNPMIVLASPKKVYAEYRFVVADKKVIAGSQYRNYFGELESRELSPSELVCKPAYHDIFPNPLFRHPVECATAIAEMDWQPERIYTVDVCEIDGSYRLLEINSFSCSGLYACNPEPIIREASRIASEEYDKWLQL